MRYGIVLCILLLAGCVTPRAGRSGPDLEIQAGELLVHPVPLTAGQGVTLEAKVRNSGSATAGEFKIGFYADGQLLGTPLTAVNLDPQEFIVAEGTWVPERAGQVRLEARADILDQVSESREYNNTRFIYLTVQPAPAAAVPVTPPAGTAPVTPVVPAVPVTPVQPATPAVEYVTVPDTRTAGPAGTPDLAVALADLSYSQAPQAGVELTLSLSVRNLGTADVPQPVTFLVLVNDVELPVRARLNRVPPGDAVMVHLPWTPAAEGWATVKIVVDPDGAISELGKENNTVSRQLYVRP